MKRARQSNILRENVLIAENCFWPFASWFAQFPVESNELENFTFIIIIIILFSVSCYCGAGVVSHRLLKTEWIMLWHKSNCFFFVFALRRAFVDGARERCVVWRVIIPNYLFLPKSFPKLLHDEIVWNVYDIMCGMGWWCPRLRSKLIKWI